MATGEGLPTWDDVQALTKERMLYAGAKIPGGLVYYHATEAGCAAAKLSHEEYIALSMAIRESIGFEYPIKPLPFAGIENQGPSYHGGEPPPAPFAPPNAVQAPNCHVEAEPRDRTVHCPPGRIGYIPPDSAGEGPLGYEE